MKLKQICNHPAQFLQDGSDFTQERSHKLSRLADMLQEAIENGESLLIFSQFREICEQLHQFIIKTLHYNTYLIHGGTTRAKREQMIEEFQHPEIEPSVFILSLKAGGVGITLTKANDYVEVADSKSLDITGDITLVVWLYKRPAGRGTLVGKWKQVGDVWSYVLYDRGEGGGGWRLRWGDQSQTNLEGPYTFDDNSWVHNAATYDGSKMKVFENGKEIGTIDASKEIDVTENPVWIGNDGYQQHFNGILDEVAIFNVALTLNEIKTILADGLERTLAVSQKGKLAATWASIKCAQER